MIITELRFSTCSVHHSAFALDWEGEFFEEKEVTVYYKIKSDKLILLTVKARYGKNSLKE